MEEVQWITMNAEGHLIVETINVTAMRTNGQQVMKRKAHITAVQEHSMTEAESKKYVAEASKVGLHALMGPKDPEHTRKSGGVGIQCRKPFRPSAPGRTATGCISWSGRCCC